MIDNNVLGLYDHNLESYKKVDEAFKSGERIVGIVHATGTGKSLNALQLALDNKDKKILYLTPYNSIIEHINEIIEDNPNVDLERDFGHVTFANYASLINMSRSEIEALDVDMVILDEFHHIGAPVWGDRINTLLETHSNLLVFGMTAYSVRDRGTAYERDLAEAGGDELFSDKIVSYFDLADAMIEGVLPVPLYKSAHVGLLEMAEDLEKTAKQKISNTEDLNNIIKMIRDIKRRVSTDDRVVELLNKTIKPDGKYIYFCPPVYKVGVNDVETIMKETKEHFLTMGYKEEDLCFYVSTSFEIDRGKESRRCFYNDLDYDGNKVDHKLRIMFTMNQYNEGVHAPNVDGVILGRETRSDIVFFEQIGRALSVRGDSYNRIIEYRKLSIDEITKLCNDKEIDISGCLTKDDMIERLVAPVIIDLVGNYGFIKDLVTDLKHRIRERKENNDFSPRILNISENAFSVDFAEQNLFEALITIKNYFIKKTWDESFALASNYYDTYKKLNIPKSFKTQDGISYDEYGFALGEWILTQRSAFKKSELSKERIDKLNSIGMIWYCKKSFRESFELAKIFYEKNGHLRIPSTFKTNDGIHYDEYGYALGNWLALIRTKKKKGMLGNKEIAMLEDIGVEWSILKTWDETYLLAVAYYRENGDLNIPRNYITLDGYNLGEWLRFQKDKYSRGELGEREIILLEDLGIKWSVKKSIKNLTWLENYELLVKYYKKYGNTDVKRTFKTFDGITDDNDGYNLGMWVSRQRVKYKEGKLSQDKIDKMNSINFSWNDEVVVKSWEEAYLMGKKYYDHYNHLNILTNFKTYDGILYDENGYNLGAWIYTQRNKFKNNELSIEKIDLLNKIGMIWNVSENYAAIKETFKKLKINPRRYASQVKDLSYLEFYAKVRLLLDLGLPVVEGDSVNSIFTLSDAMLIEIYGVDRNSLISNYISKDKEFKF